MTVDPDFIPFGGRSDEAPAEPPPAPEGGAADPDFIEVTAPADEVVAEADDVVESGDEVVAQADEVAAPADEAVAEPREPADAAGVARDLEALLFLAPDPVPVAELADALRLDEPDVAAGLQALRDALDGRGLVLRELAGGWALGSHPDAEEAARRLLARPRTPALTPAQAETLSIVAYLQPVSRPEVARIRGVASESATTALADRGLIEEAGRSQFGAVLYRTTPLFLKLFGLASVDELPDPGQWDPSPEEQAALRDRLLRAGEARSGATPAPAA